MFKVVIGPDTADVEIRATSLGTVDELLNRLPDLFAFARNTMTKDEVEQLTGEINKEVDELDSSTKSQATPGRRSGKSGNPRGSKMADPKHGSKGTPQPAAAIPPALQQAVDNIKGAVQRARQAFVDLRGQLSTKMTDEDVASLQGQIDGAVADLDNSVAGGETPAAGSSPGKRR
jgi:hypothetical protein